MFNHIQIDNHGNILQKIPINRKNNIYSCKLGLCNFFYYMQDNCNSFDYHCEIKGLRTYHITPDSFGYTKYNNKIYYNELAMAYNIMPRLKLYYLTKKIGKDIYIYFTNNDLYQFIELFKFFQNILQKYIEKNDNKSANKSIKEISSIEELNHMFLNENIDKKIYNYYLVKIKKSR